MMLLVAVASAAVCWAVSCLSPWVASREALTEAASASMASGEGSAHMTMWDLFPRIICAGDTRGQHEASVRLRGQRMDIRADGRGDDGISPPAKAGVATSEAEAGDQGQRYGFCTKCNHWEILSG